MTTTPTTTMTTNPPDAPSDERRQRILDAALSEFAEKGFHRASTNAIAERAGVAKGLVFHHFKSKDELFDAVAASVMAQMTERFEHTMQDAPTELFARLARWTRVKLAFMQEDPRLWQFWLASLREGPEGRGARFRDESEAWAKGMLKRFLADQGERPRRLRAGVDLDDVLETVWTVTAGLERAFTAALQHGGAGGEAMQAILRRLERTFAILQAGAYEPEDPTVPPDASGE